MDVKYCDLCNIPLKEKDYYLLYIIKPILMTNTNNQYDYIALLQKVEKEVKDVCPRCKTIIDEIFRLRMQNLNQLSLELLGMYEEKPKERPNGKKKK